VGLSSIHSIRLVSWNRSTKTYCPATGGYSAAHIEEEVVVTDKGCRMISLFPAEELPIANAY
jgi:Xaa-Pro dipeptidase